MKSDFFEPKDDLPRRQKRNGQITVDQIDEHVSSEALALKSPDRGEAELLSGITTYVRAPRIKIAPKRFFLLKPNEMIGTCFV